MISKAFPSLQEVLEGSGEGSNTWAPDTSTAGQFAALASPLGHRPAPAAMGIGAAKRRVRVLAICLFLLLSVSLKFPKICLGPHPVHIQVDGLLENANSMDTVKRLKAVRIGKRTNGYKQGTSGQKNFSV